MKNENLSAEERLILLTAELEEAEAAKRKSDSKILSLKENLSAERKNNKALGANIALVKEQIKNAENAELREYLDQNGVLLKDVFAAVKDGKIPKSSAEAPESAENSASDLPAENDNADDTQGNAKSVTGDTENEEDNI